MQFSIREAKAQFAQAANAAANGERVVITKHGKPFVELVPVTPAHSGNLFERLAVVRKELGLDEGGDASWFDDQIGNPDASRRLLGLDD